MGIVLPDGHGETLVSPPLARWAEVAAGNSAAALGWDLRMAGMRASDLRSLARAEALSVASAATARMGLDEAPAEAHQTIVMTGHQPVLYHPGVWAKVFLARRFAADNDAVAIDLVVDSDGFDSVHCDLPCMRPAAERCRAYLAVGEPEGCFAYAPVPDAESLSAFRAAGRDALATLSAPALGRHFACFCDRLDLAARTADNLAELVTTARRLYEGAEGRGLLELPVTEQSGGEAFLRFFAHVAARAGHFAAVHNEELARFRAARGIRSSAQPFAELPTGSDGVEVPFWWIRDGRRRPLFVISEGEIELRAQGVGTVARGNSPSELMASVAAAEGTLAPKAVALTMFERLFVADLFVHGVGGGRYDEVTDGVIRGFFEVEPPRFVVASMSMYLPLGARFVDAGEVEAAERRVNGLEHNPDRFVEDAALSAEDRRAARALVGEKRGLVEAIAAPDADRKALGGRIRQVNGELRRLLADQIEQAREARERVLAARAAADVLTDRSYPFCLWSPAEVADKVV